MAYDINAKEMSRLAQDPEAIRTLAAGILDNHRGALEGAAVSFLESLSTYTGDPILSVRQREWLSDLRYFGRRYAVAGGVSAETLVREAFCLRFDLNDDEDSEPFLEKLMTRAKPGQKLILTEREWKKLLVICGKLGMDRPDYIVFPNEQREQHRDRMSVAISFGPSSAPATDDPLMRIRAGTREFQAFVERIRAIDPAHADLIERERKAIKIRASELSELHSMAAR